ncbi:hypothetical protein [uncultured Photobacterium sp.]|uniref:hypothetical protein n=1 Tax=uncultured Photobacterium sp. TaxID=173973 RepID=UPI002635D03C|nr:hypothetical protein [uncultured Photobacterium sp.]
MTTKALTRCYRFENVDFEPDLHLLVWRDNTETTLTVHESRLLEILCYSAGEVISPQSLYDKTFIQLESCEESGNNCDLNILLRSLSRKLECGNGDMAIPIEVISRYGFRVPLPEKTCRLVHDSDKQPKLSNQTTRKPYKRSVAEHIVKHSLMHKFSVLLLAAAGIGILIVSNL